MKLTKGLLDYVKKCIDLGEAMDKAKDGNDYFYNEFPRLIVKNGYFDEMMRFVSSYEDLTASDVIGEFNRLLSEENNV